MRALLPCVSVETMVIFERPQGILTIVEKRPSFLTSTFLPLTMILFSAWVVPRTVNVSDLIVTGWPPISRGGRNTLSCAAWMPL